MAPSCLIRIYENQQLAYSGEFAGKVELGRQQEAAERLYSKRYLEREGRWRLVIALRDEDSISRAHALLEPVDETRARLENLSKKVSIGLDAGAKLEPRSACLIDLPAVLIVGRKTIRVQADDEEDQGFEVLREATAPPLTGSGPVTAFATLSLPAAGGIEVEEILRWLRETMGVLQSAATSSDFFQKAAQAIVEIVGLDSGQVLRYEDGRWVSIAWHAAPHLESRGERPPSRQVLQRVVRERRTIWYAPKEDVAEGTSLMGITAVAAAPILDRKGEVIGALYGDRRRSRIAGQLPRINRLDAMLVELLAGSVAAGLARLDMERAALEARTLLGQFFPAQLAQQAAARPELLEGQDAEITLLFCDIRNFSRVSAHLGPGATVEWINDVMGVLSDCVLEHGGVLVDYIGDELMAMWGAPEEQPDQARLAARAALGMLRAVRGLNDRWLPTLGSQFDVGIGLNTGLARVGNMGSRRKFKYGPLGSTVNLASRVQGMTKHYKVRLLATRATFDRLGGEFPGRRLGWVRTVNIDEPADLFELTEPGLPRWDGLRSGYESALADFEAGEFRGAARTLGSLMPDHPEDGPSLLLMSRAVNAMMVPESFDKVFTAGAK